MSAADDDLNSFNSALNVGRIAVYDRNGQLGTVDPTQLQDMLSRGGRVATDDEIQGYRDRKEYGGDVSDEVKAGLLGTARSISFGLSDQLMSKTGIVEGETLRKIREANPSASLAGEIGGVVAPALLSGGTSLLATGAKAVGTLPRLATEAGLATERLAARTLAKGLTAEGLIARTAAKAVQRGLGSAVEGAAYGVGQSITEDALGEKPLNAENILANMGTNALFGAAIPVGLTTGTALLSVPARKAAQSVQKVGNFLADFAKAVVVDKTADAVSSVAGGVIGAGVGGVLGGAGASIGTALALPGHELVSHRAATDAAKVIGAGIGSVAGFGAGVRAARVAGSAVDDVTTGASRGPGIVSDALGDSIPAQAAAEATAGVAHTAGRAAGKAVRSVMEQGVPWLSSKVSGMERSTIREGTKGAFTAEGAARRQFLTTDELAPYAKAMAGAFDEMHNNVDNVMKNIEDSGKLHSINLTDIPGMESGGAGAFMDPTVQRSASLDVLLKDAHFRIGRMKSVLPEGSGRARQVIEDLDKEMAGLQRVTFEDMANSFDTWAKKVSPGADKANKVGKAIIKGGLTVGDRLVEAGALWAKTHTPAALMSLGLDDAATNALHNILKKAGDGAEEKLAQWVTENRSLYDATTNKMRSAIDKAEKHLATLEDEVSMVPGTEHAVQEGISSGFSDLKNLAKNAAQMPVPVLTGIKDALLAGHTPQEAAVNLARKAATYKVVAAGGVKKAIAALSSGEVGAAALTGGLSANAASGALLGSAAWRYGVRPWLTAVDKSLKEGRAGAYATLRQAARETTGKDLARESLARLTGDKDAVVSFFKNLGDIATRERKTGLKNEVLDALSDRIATKSELATRSTDRIREIVAQSAEPQAVIDGLVALKASLADTQKGRILSESIDEVAGAFSTVKNTVGKPASVGPLTTNEAMSAATDFLGFALGKESVALVSDDAAKQIRQALRRLDSTGAKSDSLAAKAQSALEKAGLDDDFKSSAVSDLEQFRKTDPTRDAREALASEIADARQSLQDHLEDDALYGQTAKDNQALYNVVRPYQRISKRIREATAGVDGKTDPAKLEAFLKNPDPKLAEELGHWQMRSKALIEESNRQKLVGAFNLGPENGVRHLDEAMKLIDDAELRKQFKNFRKKNSFAMDLAFMGLATAIGGVHGFMFAAGRQLLSNPALMIEALSTVERYSARVAAETSKAVDSFLIGASLEGKRDKNRIGKALDAATRKARGLQVPLVTNIFKEIDYDSDSKESYETVEDAFFARLDEVNRLAGNPQLMVERVTGTMQGLAAFAPGISQHASQRAIESIHFLASKAPKVQTDMFTGKRIPPSESEMKRWARYMKAVNDPVSVLQDMQHFRMSKEGIETLKSCWPEIYKSVTDQMLQKLPKLRQKLSYEQRNQLSQLFGVPVEATTNPKLLARLQQRYQQKGQGGQQQAQPTGKPVDIASSMSTDLERVRNR